MDDQAKMWKLNERLRKDLDEKSRLADETAEKLRVAKSHLAATEEECAKYKRTLQLRDTAIRQATSKILVRQTLSPPENQNLHSIYGDFCLTAFICIDRWVTLKSPLRSYNPLHHTCYQQMILEHCVRCFNM